MSSFTDFPSTRNVVITGGAGFIGSNLAAHLLSTTEDNIILLDSLVQPGARQNLAWLQTRALPDRLKFIRGDMRDATIVQQVIQGADEVFHLAGNCEKVPSADANSPGQLSGTLNLLEAARRSPKLPMVLYVSTCRVYQSLDSASLREAPGRYLHADTTFKGFTEDLPLDRGGHGSLWIGSDVAVQQYARRFDVPALVLRLDTAAGPRQFPTERRGWVAHMVDQILSGHAVDIYGTGLQVRDVLHVSDLIEAMLAARAYLGVTAGKVYNAGGGLAHSASVLEMIALIERVSHRSARVRRLPARPGLAPFFVADSGRLLADTNWRVRRSLEQTVRDVVDCWNANQQSIRSRSIGRRSGPVLNQAA